MRLSRNIKCLLIYEEARLKNSDGKLNLVEEHLY